MTFIDIVINLTPVVGQAAKVRKFLMGGETALILDAIGDNRFQTARQSLERARLGKPSGIEIEIRGARRELLGAYDAYQQQLTGMTGRLRQVRALLLPAFPNHAIYEKLALTAVLMALCDKALGETKLLRLDLAKAQTAFDQYAERLEGMEYLEIGPDVAGDQKEAAFRRINARQAQEKAAFAAFCAALTA